MNIDGYNIEIEKVVNNKEKEFEDGNTGERKKSRYKIMDAD